MKKYLLLFALTAIWAVSCENNTTTDVSSGENGVVLSVSLAQTRVALGNKVGDTYPAYWSEGDKLVANGEESEKAVIDANSRSEALFRFPTSASLVYPLNITYPYCATTTAEHPKVEFPVEQGYVDGGFEVGSAPMCGYAVEEGGSITLNHLATILRFPIISKSEGVVLDKVVITSSSKIAGVFEVDCQSATISATEGCKNVVTYLLPENFTLSATTPKDLFIALPAVEVSDCEIEFVETSGEKMVAHWSPTAPLSKGVVKEFNTIAYQRKLTITLPSMYGEEEELTFPYKKHPSSNEIKIMSFNVRTKTTESDATNNWDNRKDACVELITDQRPNIIGFQEAKYDSQWLYLKEQLASIYDGYGVNRDTGAESGIGEVMGILYDRSVIEKIDGGTFWLSETPEKPSKGFGANYYRNATWGVFKHIPTGEIFYYINTHLDHQVAQAQIEGMKLISLNFQDYKDLYPLFLTGDMNITADNVAMDAVEGYMYNTRDAAPTSVTDYDNTYNGYKVGGKSVIDHIYCSNYLPVIEYHTIDEWYGVNFVSDHYPVYAIIRLK